MPALKVHKVVAVLPDPLEADSIYFVRVGTGVSLHVTNGAGQIVAYGLNVPSPAKTTTIALPYTVTEFRTTVADAEVTAASAVQAWLAPVLETDENDPEWLDCTQCVAASVTAGSFDLFLSFATPQGGPVQIDYRVI